VKPTHFLVLISSLTAGACATAPSAPTDTQPAQPGFTRYKVTVVSASIAAETPEHQAWHKVEPSAAVPVLKSLATFSSIPFLPEAVDAMVGERRSGSGIPPSPQVKVHIGSLVLQSGAIRTTLEPQWHWSFALDRRDYVPDSPISFVIGDADGGREIGTHSTTVAQLLDHPGTQVKAPPSVGLLQIAVEPLPDVSKTRTYHFSIPANQSLMSRILNQGPRSDTDWRAIPILNGDSIHVVAKGTVTLDPGLFRFNEPVGPKGIQVSMGVYPHPLQGCEEMPSGALVAILAGRCRLVGTEQEFPRVEEAGQLLLVINDADEIGGNSGQFDVTVEVNSPDLIKQRHPSPEYQAPSWGQ
jgi:hypothetical protein